MMKIRYIMRETFGSTTSGFALRFWNFEVGIGFVNGRHWWLHESHGRTQENDGYKIEFQIWRIPFGMVLKDRS